MLVLIEIGIVTSKIRVRKTDLKQASPAYDPAKSCSVSEPRLILQNKKNKTKIPHTKKGKKNEQGRETRKYYFMYYSVHCLIHKNTGICSQTNLSSNNCKLRNSVAINFSSALSYINSGHYFYIFYLNLSTSEGRQPQDIGV